MIIDKHGIIANNQHYHIIDGIVLLVTPLNKLSYDKEMEEAYQEYYDYLDWEEMFS